MKKWVTGILAGAGMLVGLSGVAQATAFNVKSTSVVNCHVGGGGVAAPHGLWTGNQNFSGGSCGNFYNISGVFQVIDGDADKNNWTASLNAFAINPQGTQAKINLTFSDFSETGNYKREGGAAFTSDIDFFKSIDGTIEIVGDDTFTVASFASIYSFQWGPGANAKHPDEFGGSSWLLMNNSSGSRLSGHWDLNLTFTSPPTTTTQVPEPGLVALFGIGLLGLGLARRRVGKA